MKKMFVTGSAVFAVAALAATARAQTGDELIAKIDPDGRLIRLLEGGPGLLVR